MPMHTSLVGNSEAIRPPFPHRCTGVRLHVVHTISTLLVPLRPHLHLHLLLQELALELQAYRLLASHPGLLHRSHGLAELLDPALEVSLPLLGIRPAAGCILLLGVCRGGG